MCTSVCDLHALLRDIAFGVQREIPILSFPPEEEETLEIWHSDLSLSSNWSFAWTSVMPNFPGVCLWEWVITLHMLTLSESAADSRNVWPAESGTISYKQDGYHTPRDATLSESTRRSYWEEGLCFDLAFPSVTRATKQESAPHIIHTLTD